MRVLDGRPLFSATDLTDFLACEHLTQLNRRAAEGETFERTESAMAVVLRRHGERHESGYLAGLDDGTRRIKLFDDDATRYATSRAELERAAGETEAAMEAGYDVIYQPCLFDGRWVGRADFLRRVDVPSALGAFSYEVLDTKLSRRVRPGALLQLGEYSRQVSRIQGVRPERMWVVLGDSSEHPFLVDDFADYLDSVRQRLERAVAERTDTYPEKVEHCEICVFATLCDRRRRQDGHLSLVARMRRDQVRRLTAAGVSTVQQLASARLDDSDGLRIPAATLLSLQQQARMQVHGPHADGAPRHELLPEWNAGFGLCALPPPSPGDIFFDIEGDPWAVDGGLEYLLGAVEVVHGDPVYQAWLGHTPREERIAFENFIDFAIARLDAHPGMHIYHYADYERRALQRLMGRYGTREAEVDRLLRQQVLVDLYRVVRQSLRLSTESYGLKAVEALYMPKRRGEIANAESSMIAYERWLDSDGDAAHRDPALLDGIIAYNEEDCASTWRLRNWLEACRANKEENEGLALARPPAPSTDGPAERLQELSAAEALRTRLCGDLPDSSALRSREQQATWLVAQLLGYHRREEKVQWWRYFRQIEASPEELDEDAEALGPLTPHGSVGTEKRSDIFRFTFEPQEHRTREGRDAFTPCTVDGRRTAVRTGEVWGLDDTDGTIDIKRTAAIAAKGDPRYLIEGKPLETPAQAAALMRVGEWVAAHGIDARGPHRAVRDLLLRSRPRFRGVSPLLARRSETAEELAVRAVLDLDAGCLAVQGPPGAGKTYTVARIALRLVEQGRRVAVAATSHKAIGNLLREISDAGRSGVRRPRILQKATLHDRCDAEDVEFAESNDEVVEALAQGAVDVVGGTSWLLADARLAGAFDTLIVDEAGQMSLADAVAIGECARNVVLVGDPRQLAQVVQGSHPDGAGRSALEHILGDEATIPDDRGVFLDRTWRMCSEVCGFVSHAFYGGRLRAEVSCDSQHIDGDGGSIAGLRLIEVEHEGDRTHSAAEAECVARVVEGLLGRRWRDRTGEERLLTLDDILVVAPYNSHVACLKQALPAGARVGTVDKFQGQEAAVSIFSMATSSTDDVPRNLEFLFSMNRLNVAVSRAQCLSVLVCSPQLLKADCRTVHQMRLVNALCRYVAMATRSDGSDLSAAPREMQLTLAAPDILPA